MEAGLRIVDVGTGAGDAAARATERGAQATGVDVASSMVEVAARRQPATTFVEASVTELPFAAESFDAAVGNIVIQHVGEPERAAGELFAAPASSSCRSTRSRSSSRSTPPTS